MFTPCPLIQQEIVNGQQVILRDWWEDYNINPDYKCPHELLELHCLVAVLNK